MEHDEEMTEALDREESDRIAEDFPDDHINDRFKSLARELDVEREARLADRARVEDQLKNLTTAAELLDKILVREALPKIQKELKYCAGIDADIDRRLRRLEQHFRPWPESLPATGCDCG